MIPKLLSRRSRRAAPSPRDASPVADLAYAYEPRALTRGNRIEALVDGVQTYPAMLEAIEAARQFVHLETYILRDDRIGQQFADALIRRARAGVAVRVITDAFGSISLSDGFVGGLVDAGVDFLWYRPLARWRNWGRWTRRDHRKILIVDGTVGFTGGLNIGVESASPEMDGDGWRDTHARVEGPIVAELEELFSYIWHAEGARPYSVELPPRPAKAGPDAGCLASVVGNRDRRQRTGIRRTYLHAIAMARETVYIANAYFVPDAGVRRALRRAVKRGVEVSVMVPSHSDLRSVQFAGERSYARLLKAGVRIYQWPRTHMHAKTAVVDAVWSTIGSYNLDYVSLLDNLEVNVQVIDRDFGAELRRIHEADLERCRELALATWKKRPWWQKLLERLFYRFRRWL